MAKNPYIQYLTNFFFGIISNAQMAISLICHNLAHELLFMAVACNLSIFFDA
jgi:hypothetical protein